MLQLQHTGISIRRVARGVAWSLERLVHTSGACTSTPTTRGSLPSAIPYLSTDRFGRPNLIHPASAPEGVVRQEDSASGAPRGGTPLRRGRRAPAPRQQIPTQAPSHDAAQNPVDVASLQRSFRLPSSNPPPNGPHQHEGSTQHAMPDSPTLPTRLKGPAWRERSEPPRSPQERQDRTLTYQLTKAASLREIDDLLKQNRGAPNMIHLAAAARQAVLLGSLPRPHEVRGLLDRHMERLAAVQKAAGEFRMLAAGSSGDGSGGGGGGGGGSGGSAHAEGPRGLAEAPKPGVRAQGVAAVADAPTARGAAAGSEAGKAPSSAAADGAAGPPLHSLREVGDVLWAYGKLRAKPPVAAWDSVIRPLLLAPGMLTVSPQPSPSDNDALPSGVSPSRGRFRPRDEPYGPQPTEQPPMGQDLAKVAVALARMRELDAQVWRAVARAAAAAAPELPPRALSSILWAFGSARMTHAQLLASSVRAVRSHVHQYNCQDLACTMWAVARLAPPLVEQGTVGAAGAMAAAAAAAAGEGAMQLLRGELSDAVRRRLQQQSFKPAELTTLVGALYELSCMYGEAHGGSDEMEAHARTPSTSASRGGGGSGGGAAAVLGARLLRAVSQGVRKSMASLPVGALAEAAEAFQRLGVQDAALYRALAAGLLPRLQHLDGRGLVRAAQALRAAGHDDQGFYEKVLLAARPKLPGLSRHELVALVRLCQEVAAGQAGASSSGRQRGSPSASLPSVDGLAPSDTTSSGSFGAGTGSEAVIGFLHAAILHGVSLRLGPGGSGGESAMQLARTGAAGATQAERGGVAARMDPLRLRQWHVLLRTAVACGWRDEQLADRALDAMLLELHELRAAWLDRVSERAIAEQHEQQQRRQDGAGGAVAVKQGREGWQEDEEGAAVGRSMGSADGIAGLVTTAKEMGRQDRVDVVAAAAGLLMEGFRLAGCQAGEGVARPGGQAAAVLLSHGAARELADGLGYFEPALQSSGSRTARAVVHLLQKRLAVDVHS